MVGRLARSLVGLLVSLLASCNALSPREQTNLDVFDTYWQALADRYPFFAQKHIDWLSLGEQYRPAAVFAPGPAELYHVLAGMLSELRDSHVSLQIPAANWGSSPAKMVMASDAPGFAVAMLEGRMFVTAWPPGAEPVPPEHLASERPRPPEIVRIDGYPVVPSLVDVLLWGPAGSSVELQLRWSDGTLTHHELRRPQLGARSGVSRPLVAAEVGTESKANGGRLAEHVQLTNGRWAVLRIDTLSLAKAGADLLEFIGYFDARLAEAESAEGLILDLRQNFGGDAGLTSALAGRFLTEPYTIVQSAHRSWSWFGLVPTTAFVSTIWTPRAPHFDKPLVVLTSWRTSSAAEHLARILQRSAGAVVVGERTMGVEAAIEQVMGPDGSVLKFGRERLMEVSGRGLQDEGVVPDLAIPLRLEDLQRAGNLPQASREWTERLLQAAARSLAARAAGR